MVSDMLDFIKNNKQNKPLDIHNSFHNEKIITDHLDYYYSNVVSRASKTMTECRSLRNNLKKTGTEG